MFLGRNEEACKDEHTGFGDFLKFSLSNVAKWGFDLVKGFATGGPFGAVMAMVAGQLARNAAASAQRQAIKAAYEQQFGPVDAKNVTIFLRANDYLACWEVPMPADRFNAFTSALNRNLGNGDSSALYKLSLYIWTPQSTHAWGPLGAARMAAGFTGMEVMQWNSQARVQWFSGPLIWDRYEVLLQRVQAIMDDPSLLDHPVDVLNPNVPVPPTNPPPKQSGELSPLASLVTKPPVLIAGGIALLLMLLGA